jgi:hypothetical protein
MAVTRINNNQITDAVAGNVYLGINANTKLQNYSITSTKIANNLTYGSDLTVTGNLTVQGNTTAIDTTITTIEDPVILLASMQTGTPAVDIGFIGQRGTSENIAFVWQESTKEFVTAFTSTAESNTVITVTGYANIHTANATIGGNVKISGTTSLGGNIISDANVTGTVTGGNLATAGTASAGGNITGGNILTAGYVSATGNITTANYFFGNGRNITGVTADSANAETLTGTFLANNVINSSLQTVGVLSNLSVSGNTTSGNLATGGQVSATGTVTGGNIATGGYVSATGDVTGGNVNTTGVVTASGTVTGGNLVTGGYASASGDVTGANLYTGGAVSATGSITGGNLYTSGSGGDISGSGNIIGGNIITGGLITATGEVTGANLVTGGVVTATGNIATSNYFVGNGRYISGVTADSANAETLTGTFLNSTVINSSLQTVGVLTSLSVNGEVTQTGGNINTSGYVSATGDVTGGNVNTIGIVTASGTVTGGNLATGGTVSASGDITGANVNANGYASASGDITGANLYTGGAVSATGSITGGNIYTSGSGGELSGAGNITGGNINTSGLVTASGNVNGGNINTGGTVSATGNITGANVNTAQVYGATALTLSAGTGNINLGTFGNVVLANTYINGVAYPAQDQDAANKLYVDNLASTGLTFHTPVYAATSTTLDTATGGTVSYAQPNGVSNGVGAYLQTTGSFDLIDTANVQTVGTRILIKNEANAAWNGVYGWANATTIVRTLDTDTYGTQPNTLSLNDYFFTTNGNVNAGTAFVVNAPTGTITFGTSDITFAVFSQVTAYTANTAAGISLTGTVFSAKVDNNTTAFDGLGNIIVKAGANLTTPNIGAATGTSLSVTSTVTGGNLATGGTVSATGTATVGNLATGGTVSATGTVTGGNLSTGGTISGTGNITGGNVLTSGLVSATGSVTSGDTIYGANVSTTGFVTATGDVTGGNLITAGQVSATSDVHGGNLLTTGVVSATGTATVGNVATGGYVSATGNVTGNYIIGNGSQLTGVTASSANAETLTGTFIANNVVNSSLTSVGILNGVSVSGIANLANVTASGYVSAIGTVTAGNVNTAGAVSATGTVTGGNIATGGYVSATGDVTGGNLKTSGSNGNITGAGNISAGGNVTGGNILTGGYVSATGNIITANYLFGDGYYISNINAANVSSTKITNGGSYANVITPNGNVVVAIGTSSNVVATFYDTGININGNVSTTGNVTAENIRLNSSQIWTNSTFLSIGVANPGGGKISIGDQYPNLIQIGANTTSATLTLGNTTSTVNIPGDTTAGNLSATGNVEGNFLVTTSGGIDSPAANLFLNYSQLNTNTGIYDSTGNITFFVDAGTGTASFGNATQTINSIVSFNATNSIKVPVGNSAQRPVGSTGQFRFNTTTNYLEVYDNNMWTQVGAPSYTLITDQQFNGDGTTVVFTLSGNATTAGTIVSINGVQQIPTTAYAVSGVTLTFTEAPAVGDLIDVRVLTTTTTVYSISNGLGTAEISVVDGSSNIAATGNLVVSGNVYAQNFVNTSDASLKDNVTPIVNAGQVVDGLQGVGYDWKDGSGHAYGMIAQAVEQILPEAVSTNAEGIKSVNYIMVIPFLIETVKELRQDIEAIKAQIQK